METNNTRKTNKNKNIKHTNYPFKQHNSKNTRIVGKKCFLTESKTSNKTKAKTQIKNKKYQKQRQHRNSKAETYTMKTKTRTTGEKNKLPIMKATWV